MAEILGIVFGVTSLVMIATLVVLLTWVFIEDAKHDR